MSLMAGTEKNPSLQLEQKLRKNRIKSRKAAEERRRADKAKKEGHKAGHPKKMVKLIYRSDKFDLKGLQKVKKVVPTWKAEQIAQARKAADGKKTAPA